MPVLPFLEDTEENVLGIVREAKRAGARFIYPAFGMTMRDGQREWYYRELEDAIPFRMSTSRSIRLLLVATAAPNPYASSRAKQQMLTYFPTLKRWKTEK